jgi:hypothetical protein
MKRSGTLFAVVLAATLALTSAVLADQDPVVLPTAVHTIDLNVGTVPPTTTMGVAFFPQLNRYYGGTGGFANGAVPAYTFSAAGALLATTNPINVDCRGFYYNVRTNSLEMTSFNTKAGGTGLGIFRLGISGAGVPTGTNTLVLASAPGFVDDQTMPAYDGLRDRLYSRSSSANPFLINIVSHATGALLGTVQLDTTGLGLRVVPPAGAPTLSSFPVGFDSTFSVFLTLDTTRPRVLVHRLDGSFLGASALPASPTISVPTAFGMGYSNGQLFLFGSTSGVTSWFGYRVLDPPVTSTASASTVAKQYNLIAYPVAGLDTTVAGHFTAALGSPDTTQWRLGHWLADRASYAMAGPFYTGIGQELTGIHPGLGYWFVTKGAQTLSVDGNPSPSTFVTPLINGPSAGPGFNQLGNPYEVSVPVNSIRVRQGTNVLLVTDATNAITDHVVWTWNGTAYVSVGAGGSVPAGQGFWIRKPAVGSADLVLPRPGVNPAPQSSLAGPRVAETDPRLWDVSVTASQGERSSNALTLGAAVADPALLMAMSYELPPSPPGSFLRLVTRRTDTAGADLAFDYQAPGARMAWDVVLTGASAPGEISLDVAASGVPSDLQLRLIDATTGQTYEVVVGRRLTLAAYAGTRTFRLEATSGGAAAAASPAEPFRFAYPNPFRLSTGMSFALARGGDATVDVFDLQGRLVRSIERRGLSAGEHVLVWDGRDRDGVSAKSGVYLARWRTPDHEGTARLVKLN